MNDDQKGRSVTDTPAKLPATPAKPLAALSPSKMMDLLFPGAPPLIPGEDAKDYQQLLAAVTNEIKPVDFMETIWTRDIVDLQWEIIRFRRIKADLITCRHDRIDWSIQTLGEKSTPTRNLRADIAYIVAQNIDAVERIDHMVMTMEARRNAAYREAERHRIGLGERLRRVAEQAEFREVDDAADEEKRAA